MTDRQRTTIAENSPEFFDALKKPFRLTEIPQNISFYCPIVTCNPRAGVAIMPKVKGIFNHATTVHRYEKAVKGACGSVTSK